MHSSICTSIGCYHQEDASKFTTFSLVLQFVFSLALSLLPYASLLPPFRDMKWIIPCAYNTFVEVSFSVDSSKRTQLLVKCAAIARSTELNVSIAQRCLKTISLIKEWYNFWGSLNEVAEDSLVGSLEPFANSFPFLQLKFYFLNYLA